MSSQGKGYEKKLVQFISEFFRKSGFEPSHRVKNFFTDKYDHHMFDGDKQLVDMIYLRKRL